MVNPVFKIHPQGATVGDVTMLSGQGNPLRQPVRQHFPAGEQNVTLDTFKQRRTTLYFFLNAAQHLQNNPVGELFHKGVVVEVDELVQPGAGDINDLVLVQPVNDGNNPQHPQNTQAADGHTAHQVVPVNERIEIPAVINPGLDGVAPPEHKLTQKDEHKDHIVEDETFVDRVIALFECRSILLQQVLHGHKAVGGVPDNQPEIEDQQPQHHKVDDEPGQLVAGFEVFSVYFEHPGYLREYNVNAK